MTTIKPVTIPREAADRIEGLRSSALSNERIVDVYVSEGRGTPPSTRGIRSISFDTLLSALVNGYERELTEEEARELAYEELREIYATPPQSMFARGFDEGLIFTLNTLGIVIPGINDEKGGAA
ncbi:hypothetical protein MKX34_24155 [Paenibacillus sp. FSL R5-0636]|uniref:hypothetical protein n=1 Tax=Paenibacillus TaxID=44249 RepID=UPI00096F592B|nr:hypothetical protein [Paenibacillus odorifer]OMC96260.1 hypothetical protein BJP49_11200 [Paenibacillus odorifer]